MVKNKYYSTLDPRVAAQILRAMERIACDPQNWVPNGWRAIVEFQTDNEPDPYFCMDISSNKGGGDYAPVKQEMMKRLNLPHTGGMDAVQMMELVKARRFTLMSELKVAEIQGSLCAVEWPHQLGDDFWATFMKDNFTYRWGGITVPYDMLSVKHERYNRDIVEYRGVVRISFDSVKDNAPKGVGYLPPNMHAIAGTEGFTDAYLAMRLFMEVQRIFDRFHETDQTWWNLRTLSQNEHLKYEILKRVIYEAQP